MVDATATAAKAFHCDSGGLGPDSIPSVDVDCAKVTAQTAQETATSTLDAARARAGIAAGDRVKLIRMAAEGQPVTFEFYDY